MNLLKNRFDRLVNRLLDEGLVPFLGAGISRDTKIPGDPSFKPTVECMKDKLLNRIIEELGKDQYGSLTTPIWSLILDDDGNFRKELSLDRVAEIGAWLWGHEAVCETAEIKKYSEIEPTAAHFYLAFLAREGLITEIITTNYDCCMEKAFRRSFTNPEDGKTLISVIWNLSEYREKGGKRFSGKMDGHPILHLQKINGCAHEYPAKNSCPPERIILTERQLQNFRHEQWAQDLFRDRARRRNLLFCGFGSEEPQVRHTALAICDEFGISNSENEKEITPQKIADLPNAPFLVARGKPSFAQLQIMIGFIQAHGHKFSDLMVSNQNIADLLPNIFSETDAIELGKTRKMCKGLTADLFFERLFQTTFKKLIHRYSEENSIFFNWLRPLTNYPREWVGYLRNRLCSENMKRPAIADGKEDFLPADYFGTCRCLLEFSAGGPLNLFFWLWSMRYPAEEIPPGTKWYLPLREDSLFVLTSLLLIFCLNHYEKFEPGLFPKCPLKSLKPVKEDDKGYGLEIEVGFQKHETMRIYLVHRNAIIPFQSKKVSESEIKKTRIRYFIIIPSSGYYESEERWLDHTPTDPEKIWVGRQYWTDAKDLVQLAGHPEKVGAALRKVFARTRPKKPKVILELID